jgi:hypothetical protein
VKHDFEVLMKIIRIESEELVGLEMSSLKCENCRFDMIFGSAQDVE